LNNEHSELSQMSQKHAMLVENVNDIYLNKMVQRRLKICIHNIVEKELYSPLTIKVNISGSQLQLRNNSGRNEAIWLAGAVYNFSSEKSSLSVGEHATKLVATNQPVFFVLFVYGALPCFWHCHHVTCSQQQQPSFFIQ